MASWASLDKAYILSSDKDFYKYIGDQTLYDRLFSSFSVKFKNILLFK